MTLKISCAIYAFAIGLMLAGQIVVAAQSNPRFAKKISYAGGRVILVVLARQSRKQSRKIDLTAETQSS